MPANASRRIKPREPRQGRRGSPLVFTLTGLLLYLLVIDQASAGAQAGDVRGAGPAAAYRGINLTLRTNPTASDAEKLARWGVNTVRLVIHGDPRTAKNDELLLADGRTINDKGFVKLDQVVHTLTERKIRIIFCLFDFPGSSGGEIWKDYHYWDLLVSLWSSIATRYRTNPLVAGYDLMNEPSLVQQEGTALDRMLMETGAWAFPEKWANTPRDYFALMERIGRAINEISPDKAVIVEGVGLWGHPDNFLWMRPIKVQNVAYSFHMYIPHHFTDSGKNGQAASVYDSGSSRTRVLQAMAPAVAFAKKHNALIFVGELGLSYPTEGHGAGDWLRDVLGYLEQQGWGWTYWNYSLPFRSPEVVMMPDGSLARRGDTERLTVLKEYWKGHEKPVGDTLPERSGK